MTNGSAPSSSPVPAGGSSSGNQGPVVHFVDWDTVRIGAYVDVQKVSRSERRIRLSEPDPTPPEQLQASVLRIEVPEPAALERLAASGLLQGTVREVQLYVATMPPALRDGLHPPGTGRDKQLVSWQTSGMSAEGRLGWRRPTDLSSALDDALGLVLRRGTGRVEQAGGPLRTSLDPFGTTAPEGPASDGQAPDGARETDVDRSGQPEPILRTIAAPFGGPLGTAVAFPSGRTMVGEATHYRLEPASDRSGRVLLKGEGSRPVLTFDPATSVEKPLLDREWRKYATVEIDGQYPDGPFANRVLLGLAACGAVLVPPTSADSRSGHGRARHHTTDSAESAGTAGVAGTVTDRLAELGLVTVEDPTTVNDLVGYRNSARASRVAAMLGDPLLASSPLAGSTTSPRLELPGISVLIASKREQDVLSCLTAMAGQDYPQFEVLLGTHGYDLSAATLREFQDKLNLRALRIDASATLGQMLGTLSRAADGDLLAKVDDDDHYGSDHLSELFLAARTTGADLVAKSARFVHLADIDTTLDRTWAAPEAFGVVPAGGTILASRAALIGAGGWSESPKHVDAELIQRIAATGGVTYRTHGLGYVYVRRNSGHTWQADPDSLHTKNEVRYSGLPDGILTGGSW